MQNRKSQEECLERAKRAVVVVVVGVAPLEGIEKSFSKPGGGGMCVCKRHRYSGGYRMQWHVALNNTKQYPNIKNELNHCVWPPKS